MISNLAQIVCVVLALTFTQVVIAASVFDNGTPDLMSGTLMTEFVVADDFALSSTNTISNIRFWTIQSSASDYSGSISWAIYGDVGDSPSIALFSGVAAASAMPTGRSTAFGSAEYEFDIPVAFTLSAGNFWLALNNNPLSTNPSNMAWATTALGAGTKGVYFEGPDWVDTGNEHAFRLDAAESAIPEPYMPAMLIAGLLTLTRLRQFRS
jgi:hypothetical protein